MSNTQQSMVQPPSLSLVFFPSQDSDYEETGYDYFQEIIEVISKRVQILALARRNPLASKPPEQIHGSLQMPTNAIAIFVQEDGSPGSRLASSLNILSKPPWRFHHSEWVTAPEIKVHPENNQDYYVLDQELPLCSVRQIHYGQEHIRIVRFISAVHWKKSVQFYSQLLGQTPDAIKADFCVFSLEYHEKFDIQFSLKKLPRGVVGVVSSKCTLSVSVTDLSDLKLPLPCYQVSKTHWQTTDYDGNPILLEQRFGQNCKKRAGKGLSRTLHAIAEDCDKTRHLTSTPISTPNKQKSVSELDLTVKSAYASARQPGAFDQGHSYSSRPNLFGNKSKLNAFDSKHSFTYQWLMYGHQHVPYSSDDAASDQDRVSVSSLSSLETALSDPFSDRGQSLTVKTKGKYFPDPQLSPQIEQQSSYLVSSSDKHKFNAYTDEGQLDSGISEASSALVRSKKMKGKKVSFSATVQQHIVSPRVVVDRDFLKETVIDGTDSIYDTKTQLDKSDSSAESLGFWI